jgi:hypothetical protein
MFRYCPFCGRAMGGEDWGCQCQRSIDSRDENRIANDFRSILQKVNEVLTQQRTLMTGFTDLQAAFNQLVTDVQNVVTYIQTTVPAQVAAAVAAATAGDDAQAETIAQGLTTEGAALVAALPPVVVTPPAALAASYASLALFTTAVTAYTGPEEVDLDGVAVKAGNTTILAYFTHSDQGGVINTTGPTS